MYVLVRKFRGSMNTVDMVTVHSVASTMVGLHPRRNASISHFLDATGTLINIARINIRGGFEYISAVIVIVIAIAIAIADDIIIIVTVTKMTMLFTVQIRTFVDVVGNKERPSFHDSPGS